MKEYYLQAIDALTVALANPECAHDALSKAYKAVAIAKTTAKVKGEPCGDLEQLSNRLLSAMAI